jgi:hypothetical protein
VVYCRPPARVQIGGKESVAWSGIRLLPVLRYSVIFLALCLLLSDTSRLARQQIPARMSPQGRSPFAAHGRFTEFPTLG